MRTPSWTEEAVVLFRLPTSALLLVLVVVIAGSAIAGLLVGRSRREHQSGLKESSGVLQGALLGFMGLILAFGLSLALGRYEDRRAAVVDDANAIGTTYLRAQLIAEPERTRSLALLRRYTDLALRVSAEVPNSTAMRKTAAEQGVLQRRLWRLAGGAIGSAPIASAPRLYADALNTMID